MTVGAGLCSVRGCGNFPGGAEPRPYNSTNKKSAVAFCGSRLFYFS